MADKTGRNPSSIRIHNRRKVLDIIRSKESSTATEIARDLNLSKTTIWKIIDHLQNEGLVLNMGKDTTREERGKKAERYSFNRDFGYTIGIILFSDQILSALFNSRGTAFYKEKQSIQPNAPLKEIIPVITNFIGQWQKTDGETINKDSRLLGIVLASTGVTDSDNGVCFTAAKFNSWPANTPIRKLIEEKVKLEAPFYIDNYNRYSAFAEKQLGGLNEYQNIVNLVTGRDELGSGIIINGQLLRGQNYLSGEIGHMRVNPAWATSCHCGGKGCLEQMVAADRIVLKAESEKNKYPDSPVHQLNRPLSLTDIFKTADEGDLWCRELLDDTILWFSTGIQNIILLFDPEVIVISGIYNQGCDYFLKQLKESVSRVSLNRMEKKIDIRYSTLGEEAPLLGAVSYVIEDFFSRDENY
jgi:predicted NBD/HSP70 family sugar kinase/predicted transcriptional regulator